MKLQATILATLFAATLVGCGNAPGGPDPLRTSRQPIYGGVLDPGDPAVVALTDNEGYYFCSGTIVDPTHVVTAAHCISDGTTPGYIFVCPDNNNDFDDSCFLEVQGAEYNPAYTGDSANDIAVVTLSQATGITPVPIAPSSLPEAAIGTLTRIVGYGDDENGGTGVKRQASTAIDEMDAQTFIMWGLPNHCYGDSGGPAFWPAGGPDERLVGVTSAGTEDACDQGGGVDVMVGDNLGWLGSMGVFPPPNSGSGGGDTTSTSASSSSASGSSSTTSGVGAGVGGGGDVGGFSGTGAGSPANEQHSASDEASEDSGCATRGPSGGAQPAWLLLALSALAVRRPRRR